jgi:hypothetical protein
MNQRVCVHCGKMEISTDTLEGFNQWLKQGSGCSAGDGDGHLWRYIYPHEVSYRSGEPCKHPGCKAHYSHPCEACGRIGARGIVSVYEGVL